MSIPIYNEIWESKKGTLGHFDPQVRHMKESYETLLRLARSLRTVIGALKFTLLGIRTRRGLFSFSLPAIYYAHVSVLGVA